MMKRSLRQLLAPLLELFRSKLRHALGILIIKERIQVLELKQEIQQGYEHITQIGNNSKNPWIKRSSQVPGWLFEGEHEFIYQQALSAPCGQFVEIGVLFGKSLSIIAGAIEERNQGEKIFAIDPFTLQGSSHDIFVHQTTHPGYSSSFELCIKKAIELDYYKHIIPIATFSDFCLPFLDISVSFAFIDACHDKEAVKSDFLLLQNKLVKNAIILFHDASSETYPGVMEAIQEILQENSAYCQIANAGSIVAIQYQ